MTLKSISSFAQILSNPLARRSARIDVVRIVELPHEDSGLQHSIIRMHNLHIDSKRKDRSRFFRREPLVVLNPGNGEKVIRYAMGNPGGLSIKKHEVSLDYDAIATLGVRFNRDVELVVRRASTLEIMSWFFNYPDLGIRWSMRLGLLGGALGVIGLIIGLLPFMLPR